MLVLLNIRGGGNHHIDRYDEAQKMAIDELGRFSPMATIGDDNQQIDITKASCLPARGRAKEEDQ